MDKQLCIVLRAVNYKDYDRILTLFSRENGKFSAQAYGVRRLKSQLATAAQPFCCAEYEFAEKSGRVSIKNALVKEKFFNIQNDYEKYAAACVMLELSDRLLDHTDDTARLFVLLVNTLYAVEHCNADANAALAYFFVQSAVLMGLFPALDFCAVCGKPMQQIQWWSHAEGGAVCEACAPGAAVMRITKQQPVLFVKLRGVKPDAIPPIERDTLKRFLHFAAEYIEISGEVRLHTLSFLEK